MRIICDFDPSNATDRRALRAMLDAYDEGDRTSAPMPADDSDEAPISTTERAKEEVAPVKYEYFSVEEGELRGNSSNSSCYKAIGEGECRRYEFNDDGPHKEAIRNRETLITPFCDIVDEMPNADSIVTMEPGEGMYDDQKDSLSIDKKAQVKLIRQ